ncbi:MAG: outer membrane protein transport protein [Deltaproteobacteria bacterium]|nr:outer membrane protein transport protein [Deltaproteobacteria bacterium]
MSLRIAMLALAAIALPGSALANPADQFGLGARIPAMGGAGAAAVDDTSAGYYNPAAIGRFENIRIDFGYQYARPDLEINEQNTEVDTSRGFAAGMGVPGRIGSVKIALAGTFFLPDRNYVRTRALNGGQPRFQLYDNKPQRFIMAANLGLSFLDDRVAVGGGLTYMSGTKGDILLRGRVGFPDASDSELTQGLDIDVKTKPYAQAGALVKATNWLNIGLTYRGEFELELEQTLDIRGSVGARDQEAVVDNGFFTVDSLANDHYQPMQVTLGAAAQVSPTVLLAFDLSYHRWSSFDNPATVIEIDLDVGQFNEDINITEAPAFPDPGFDDIVVPRLGIEWQALRSERIAVAVRGGYSYEPSPAPEQRDENNFVDNDKHTISLGVGGSFRKLTEIIPLPFELDAYFAFTMLPERTHRKLSAADPVGDYSANGSVLQLGLGSRWRF